MSEINVVPYIDVMLVLLVIFMVTAPLITTGILDLLDYITGQALLPLGGVLISIFVGWKMSHKTLQEELNINSTIFKVWYFLVRFVCPTAILSVFFTAWL